MALGDDALALLAADLALLGARFRIGRSAAAALAVGAGRGGGGGGRRGRRRRRRRVERRARTRRRDERVLRVAVLFQAALEREARLGLVLVDFGADERLQVLARLGQRPGRLLLAPKIDKKKGK